jgi:peroxiredoxin
MAIRQGDSLPDVRLNTMNDGQIEPVSTAELARGKKLVLFAVPGAFTPTCSDDHLPGFQRQLEALRAKGVDQVACTAVNDVFVMNAWAEDREVGDGILMLADGNGELARAMGLTLDASGFGMGTRSKRYAAVVEDGVVQYLGVEPGGGVTVSSAEAVLEQL